MSLLMDILLSMPQDADDSLDGGNLPDPIGTFIKSCTPSRPSLASRGRVAPELPGIRVYTAGSGEIDFEFDPAWDEPINDKAADPSDLAKRARSGRVRTVGEKLGIVKYEQREIDGETWVEGINAAGEVVTARCVDLRD